MTEFKEVYLSFISKTPKKEFSLMSEESLEANMNFWLRYSISKFKKICRSDLGQADFSLETFNVELDLEEIEILALGMRVAFYESTVVGIDAQSSLISRDYREYSASNAIRSTESVFKKLKQDFHEEMSYYSYNPRIQSFQDKFKRKEGGRQ